MKFECILCPVDFSEVSLRACEYAYSLARHYGAKLYFQSVIEPLTATYPYYYVPEQINLIYSDLAAQAEQQLRDLVWKQGFGSVHPGLVAQQGPLAQSILAFAEAHKVDLIVMGTHGRGGLDRLMIGSVTEKVLRRSACPVLAVRKPAHDFVSHGKDQEPVTLHKILFCTDFSDAAGKSLAQALSLAMEYNAELTLIHVLEHPDTSEILQERTAAAMRELEKSIPADARNWCNVRKLVRVGKPYQEICQVALEDQIDLIVLGVRGRNAVDLAIFGSTTHRVLQLGPCPVLTVRA
ncbi:MAG TPA: universal stress protein [Terriglobia bacterium]|nr:universal stress protein [Terriglobia bacterium]